MSSAVEYIATRGALALATIVGLVALGLAWIWAAARGRGRLEASWGPIAVTVTVQDEETTHAEAKPQKPHDE